MLTEIAIFTSGSATGIGLLYWIMTKSFKDRLKNIKKEILEDIEKLEPNLKQTYENQLNHYLSIYFKDQNLSNLIKIENKLKNLQDKIKNELSDDNFKIEFENTEEIKLKQKKQSNKEKTQELDNNYKNKETINEYNKQFNKTNKYKNKQEYYKELKRKGTEFELFVGKYFKNLGYKIYYNGINNGKKDNGIDLIAYRENEVILIQCKNWNSNKYKITHKHLKEFLGNCYTFIEKHPKLLNKNIIRLYITSTNIYDKSAENFVNEHKEIIQKMILPFNN